VTAGAAYFIFLVVAASLATLRWPMVGVCAILTTDFLRPQDLYLELGVVRPVVWLAAATLASTWWHARARLHEIWRPLAPLATVVVVAALSAAASDLPSESWTAWMALAKGAVLAAVIMVHVDTPRRFEAAAWAIAGSLAILSVAGIASGLALGYPAAWAPKGGIGGPPGPDGGGPLTDNNAFARILVASLPLQWMLAVQSRAQLGRVLGAIGGATGAAALVFTFSRAGFVAAAVVGAIGLLQIRPRWKGAVALGLAIAIGVVLLPDMYRARIASITLGDSSLRLRYAVWEEGLAMAAQRPLLGVGIGTFSEHHALGAPAARRSSHNIFVEVLAETGVVGLLAYVWMLAAAGRALWRSASRAGDAAAGWSSRAALGLGLAILAYLIASTTLSHAFTTHLLTWVALANALPRAAHAAAPASSSSEAARRRGIAAEAMG
jgi:O-antigen ligase